jgi:undecaprenyl diphosphate synthase
MILTLALNYGGRQEIVEAFKRAYRSIDAAEIDKFNEEEMKKYLYTGFLPDPDFIIRTSGEKRISNFLLWQSAYAEFYFTDTLWPDFNAASLKHALEEYGRRERRFGG